MNDQLRIVERDAFERLARQLIGNVAQGGPDGLGKGKKVTKEYLDGLNVHKWFDIRMADEELQKQIEESVFPWKPNVKSSTKLGTKSARN